MNSQTSSILVILAKRIKNSSHFDKPEIESHVTAVIIMKGKTNKCSV